MACVHVFDLIAIISKKTVFFPFPIFSFKCSHILMPQIVTSLPSHPSHGLPTPIPKKFITHISPKGAPCLHSSCVLVYLYASPIPQVNSLAPGSRRISVWDPPWRISCLGWDPRIFEPKKTGVWRPGGSVLEKTMNQKDPLTRHGWAQEGWNWWCDFFCGRFRGGAWHGTARRQFRSFFFRSRKMDGVDPKVVGFKVHWSFRNQKDFHFFL